MATNLDPRSKPTTNLVTRTKPQTAHLWSPENTSILDDDTYPWQDDETINNTDLKARTKPTTNLTARTSI